MKKEITLSVKVTIPNETLENIFVTAIEGGSNYWYFLSEDAVKKVRNAIPNKKEPYLSVAIFKAVMSGVDIDINDAENEDEVLGTISLSTMEQRLQMLADSEQKWALDDELAENGDSSSSDIVFQYLTLGEVVFG